MEEKKPDPLAEALNAYLFESPAKSTFRAILARYGLVVLPVEPSEEMLKASALATRDFLTERGPYPRTRAAYRAMLAAAQEPAP
jgi:hypothetical protein